MSSAEERPLPSATAGDDEEDDGDEPDDVEPTGPAPRPPVPPIKFSPMTSLYFFLGFLGLWMLIDSSLRNQLAGFLGTTPGHSGPLYYLIGFDSHYLFLTMALAGAFEMLITALAYNYTTDWVKAAKVQAWSSAFRKAQMEAIRSGKKNRIDALKPQQQKIAKLSSEVSIAQFKGLAITYFLLILIYTWVGLVIADASVVNQTLNLGAGTTIVLGAHVVATIPWWFALFSLYTIPFSMVFRRVLKNAWLRRYAREHPPSSPAAPASGAAGGAA
jgi:uncharacterized membrane protein (DUF106 family)